MKRLERHEYTAGWICPLEVEQIAALHMLDERHSRLPQPPTDHNVYNLGSIHGHNVVIAGLPQAGNNAAATVVTQLRMSFPNVRFVLLIGIGGGVPRRTDEATIRLGDVVVSKPTGAHSGVIQYDHGKAWVGRFERTGSLAPPPTVLLNAAQNLAAARAMEQDDSLEQNMKRIDSSKRILRRFIFPGIAQDRLFLPGYVHLQQGVPCDKSSCDLSQTIARRGSDGLTPIIIVHRGTIASGEMVLKDAMLRDRLAADGLICFEMEAAGALIDFPCMVIRGISDYCDSHKNDAWHGYAAAAAASYARQLFLHIPIEETPRICHRKCPHLS
ncbi:ankyrin repeat protein [Pestalotiopsis sp. NC0098]|nr:ankyrin repeat protein [Pestalotiopsis sp. NC0098]